MIDNPNYKQFAKMPVISTEYYLNAHEWNDWQKQIRFHDGKYFTKAHTPKTEDYLLISKTECKDHVEQLLNNAFATLDAQLKQIHSIHVLRSHRFWQLSECFIKTVLLN
jgi:hypothetical protein